MVEQQSLLEQVDDAVKEIEGEETQNEGAAADGGTQDNSTPVDNTASQAKPVAEDDDLKDLDPTKKVPYDRFKSVIEKRKEAEKKAREFETKFKDIDPERYRVMSVGTDKLIKAVQNQPWLDALLSDLLDERQPNWQAVFEAVKKVIPNPADAAAATQALKDGNKVPQASDPRIDKLMQSQERVLNELRTAQYTTVVDKQLKEISEDKDLKSLTKEDVDEALKEGLLEHQLTGKIPDLVAHARNVLAKIKAIEARILQGQVANSGKKKNAGGEKGGGQTGSVPRKLNPNSPSFLKDVADMADELASEG